MRCCPHARREWNNWREYQDDPDVVAMALNRPSGPTAVDSDRGGSSPVP